MKRKLFPICYGTALALFTAYLSLDTFVLRRAYQTDTTQMNTAMFEVMETTEAASEAEELPAASETAPAASETAPAASETVPAVTETAPAASETAPAASEAARAESETAPEASEEEPSADTPTEAEPAPAVQNDEVQITLTEYEAYSTRIYVADVVLSSAQSLKTAFAEDTFGRNITAKTSEIAAAHNAVLAINGDYYGSQERGYVIRNGIVYRDTKGTYDVLCIYADGTMRTVSPDDYTAEELVGQGVWQAFSFGPGLLSDGQITVSQGQEVGKSMASNPRTAIGMISANHFVFVVSDGRTSESVGLSLYEMAEFLQGLGVTEAYNLDGGGSSTMVYNGQVINNPTTTGRIKERSVSDIVYIG